MKKKWKIQKKIKKGMEKSLQGVPPRDVSTKCFFETNLQEIVQQLKPKIDQISNNKKINKKKMKKKEEKQRPPWFGFFTPRDGKKCFLFEKIARNRAAIEANKN